MHNQSVNNMRINGINTTYVQSITFGHYLNEEKSTQERKLSNLRSEISSLEAQKHSENYSYNSQASSLDSQISQLESEVRSSNARISTLRGKVDGKGSAVDSERSRGYQYSQTIENNNNAIKKLQETQKKIYNDVIEQNEKTSELASKELLEKTAMLERDYIEESKIATEGLKSSLIQKIINPTINAMEGEKNTIPSSMCIENAVNSKENILPNIFEWIIRQTDSNFAKIRIVELDENSELKFLSMIKKIIFNSEQEYEKTGRHSFTLIDNFELLAKLKNSKFLQELLSNSSEVYHNTIIGVSNIPYEKLMSALKFNHSFKIDKTFIENRYFGLQSIMKQLSNLKSGGINLLK